MDMMGVGHSQPGEHGAHPVQGFPGLTLPSRFFHPIAVVTIGPPSLADIVSSRRRSQPRASRGSHRQ
jgi:hypothetical protein